MDFKPENLIHFFELHDDRGCYKCGSDITYIERFIYPGCIEVQHRCYKCGFKWKTKYGLTMTYDEITEKYCLPDDEDRW